MKTEALDQVLDAVKLLSETFTDTDGREKLAEGSWQREAGKEKLAKGSRQLILSTHHEPPEIVFFFYSIIYVSLFYF